MSNGCGASSPARSGWLTGIVLPLVLLVGAPAGAWHDEHADDHDAHECAVCHAEHQTADLAGPAGSVSSHAPACLGPLREIRRAVALRLLYRPARAPPA